MEYIQSIIFATVQGITEFLPISSSGHLVLTPYIFGWDYRGLGFDVALHFGTLIAIIVFFWHDIVSIISNAISPREKLQATTSRPEDDQPLADKSQDISIQKATEAHEAKSFRSYPNNLLWQILIATIPAMIVGFFISDLVEQYLHTPVLIAINLAVFGLLLWLSDSRPTSYKLQATSYKLTFLIGLFQAIALMPGVSRSGITITAGRFLGFSRENATRFSFLLGIPAMAGATLFEATKINTSQIDLPFLLAVALSAVVGFFAIKYLIEYLKRGTLAVFAVYRIILALVILAVYYLN